MSYFSQLTQNVVALPGNSSTDNINAGATYAGTGASTLGVAGIQVSLKTDQRCQVFVEQSPDNSNWDISDSFLYFTESPSFGVTVQVVASYVRVRVTNLSAAATTYFRLQTVLCPIVEALPRALTDQGELKVTTQPYLGKISEGDLQGHYLFRKLGYAPAVGTSIVDVYNSPSASVYPWPAAPIQMSVLSTSVNDAGSVNFSGTSTGGSTTTLTDTGKTFNAGTPVVAGDIILITVGNKVAEGIVTSVGATTLTCAAGFSNGASGSGVAYRVLDVSAGGTGLQAVDVHYLDGNWQEKEEVVILNGTTPVNTVSTGIFRINGFHARHCGSGLFVAGTVDIASPAVARTYSHSYLSAGINTDQGAVWTAPAIDYNGNTLSATYITEWVVSAMKTLTGANAYQPVGTARLVVTSNDSHYHPTITQMLDMTSVCGQALAHTYTAPVRVPAKADVRVRVVSDQTATVFTSRFAGWYE